MQTMTRNIFTGIVTIIPLWVTVWVVWLVVDLLIDAGRPIVAGFARALRPTSGGLADLLLAGWFQSTLALLIAVAFLAILGRAANAVLGRRLLLALNRVIDAIPLARTVYGATQTLVDALRGDSTRDSQGVVLIEFPSPEMWAVGIVTRTFPATEDREEFTAVYVATTPNPTSGFVEIVPTSRLIQLDWTKNDAIAFIVSGGAMAPNNIHFKRDAVRDGVDRPESTDHQPGTSA